MRGFTLLEVLVALTVLAVSFSVLFTVLSRTRAKLERLTHDTERFIELDRKVKRDALTGVKREELEVKGVKVLRVYENGLEFYLLK
ncbi:MAG: type II secretion system protein [Aquificae bacterium]|nr:type II secretion system protein [Aquificota bacterium]